jgi:hypothetical protein
MNDYKFSIQSASHSGSVDKENEDKVVTTRNMIAVLDGATVRTNTGCIHTITWFVDRLGHHLASKVHLPPDGALRHAIAETATEHIRTCDLQHRGTPSAGVAIAQVDHDLLRYLLLGDVTIVIETEGSVEAYTDNRVNETAVGIRAVAAGLPYGSAEKEEALVRMKEAELAARNVTGGFWVAAADPSVVSHAIVGEKPLLEVKRIALLSDGAARAVNPLGLYDWPGIMNVLSTAGPDELIRQIRAAEATDATTTHWPRNKVHDDATAVLCTLHAVD